MPPADQPPQRRAARPRRTLTVVVADERGRRIADGGLGAWLRRVAPARARGTVSVALVSDARVRALNRTYRRKDRNTDVLSFPAGESRFLGDIVIARGVAKRQAREAGHGEQTELRVLALHGLLHLLGYDHETDDGEMQRVERRLRGKGRLREGLIERSTSGAALSEPPRGPERPAPRRHRA
jgi:probable rRNA maturation factor